MDKLSQYYGTVGDINRFGSKPKNKTSFMQRRKALYNQLSKRTTQTTISAPNTQTANKKIQMMSPHKTTQTTTTAPKKTSFGTAFATARKQGLKEFTWNNKRYNTKLKGETKDYKYVKSPETKQQQLVQNKPGNQPIQVTGKNKSMPITARGIDKPKMQMKFPEAKYVSVKKPDVTKKAEYVFALLTNE